MMRTFATMLMLTIVGYLSLGGASEISAALRMGSIVPDPFAIAAALSIGCANGWCAPIGLLGLAADLDSQGRPGIGMAAYLLVGFFIRPLLNYLPQRAWGRALAIWMLIAAFMLTSSLVAAAASQTPWSCLDLCQQVTLGASYSAAIATAAVFALGVSLRRGSRLAFGDQTWR